MSSETISAPVLSGKRSSRVKPGEKAAKVKRGTVVPKKWNQEARETIVDLIRVGMTLKDICELPGMPTLNAVKYWIREDDAFREAYFGAQREQASSFVELALRASAAADTPPEGVNPNAWVNSKRLQADTLKWAAARLDPAKWGDKTEKFIKHDGNVTFEVKGLDK